MYCSELCHDVDICIRQDEWLLQICKPLISHTNDPVLVPVADTEGVQQTSHLFRNKFNKFN